jgi:hypothetical protein
MTETDLALADLEATLPQVPKVRAAALLVARRLRPDYAAKLGLSAEAQQRNKAALDPPARHRPRRRRGRGRRQELKAAAPNAPA